MDFDLYFLVFPRTSKRDIWKNGSKTTGCPTRKKTEALGVFFLLRHVYQSKYHCYSTPKSLAFSSGARRVVMFLMDSAGPAAPVAPPTCMISVAIECLSAVAPPWCPRSDFDPLCQAGAPDARTDLPLVRSAWAPAAAPLDLANQYVLLRQHTTSSPLHSHKLLPLMQRSL